MTTVVVRTSTCGHYVIKADATDKDSELQVWQSAEADSGTSEVQLGTIPRWTSDFFDAQLSVEFVRHESVNEVYVVAVHEREKVGIFRLDGTLVHESAQLNDYITGIQLVHNGTYIVIDSIMWHPISYFHIMRVSDLLSGQNLTPREIWQEGLSPAPTINDTHLFWTPRQQFSWDTVFDYVSSGEELAYVSEQLHWYGHSTQWTDGKATHRATIATAKDVIQLAQENLNEEEDDKNVVDVVAEVPLVTNPAGCWMMQFIKLCVASSGSACDQPANLEEKKKCVDAVDPVLVTLKTRTRIGVWNVTTGHLIAQTAAFADPIESFTQRGRFLLVVTRATWRSVSPVVGMIMDSTPSPRSWFLLHLDTLLQHPHAVCAGRCVVLDAGKYDGTHSEHCSIHWINEELHVPTLYQDGSVQAYMKRLLDAQWNRVKEPPFLRTLLHHLGNTQTLCCMSKVHVQFGGVQPVADATVNSLFHQSLLREPATTSPDQCVYSEHEMRDVRQRLQQVSECDSYPNMRCFGTGSRIVMDHFLRRMMNNSAVLDGNSDIPHLMFFALLGGGTTITNQLDLTFVIENAVLLRIRLKQIDTPNPSVYQFDPDAILSFFISRLG